MKGYQLIARSAGLDRDTAQTLCRWAPSHSALIDQRFDADCLNVFPVDPRHVAISRTTFGGPEYSGRGGDQVVTLFLVAPLEQCAPYEFHSVSVAETALALGHLRLPITSHPQLAAIDLPTCPLPRRKHEPALGDSTAWQQTVELLLANQRVALVGVPDPITSVAAIIDRLPIERRMDVSFTTGLHWSSRREFRLQFLPTVDRVLNQKLAAQQVRCLVPAAVDQSLAVASR